MCICTTQAVIEGNFLKYWFSASIFEETKQPRRHGSKKDYLLRTRINPLKEKTHSFQDCNEHILDKEDKGRQCFEEKQTLKGGAYMQV